MWYGPWRSDDVTRSRASRDASYGNIGSLACDVTVEGGMFVTAYGDQRKKWTKGIHRICFLQRAHIRK